MSTTEATKPVLAVGPSVGSQATANQLGANPETALFHSARIGVGELSLMGVERPDEFTDPQTSLVPQGYDSLRADFAKDPKESLALIRNKLISIGRNKNLSTEERSRQLDTNLDAYFGLILRLDHDVFPPTRPGEVSDGQIDYIPDGYNDMGSNHILNPNIRGREILHVDKKSLLERYKPVLIEMFTKDYSGMTSTEMKKSMLSYLAQQVYFRLPTDYGDTQDLGGGKINLANLPKGVCRHQALTFQVLAQAAGLKTVMVKSNLRIDGAPPGAHVSNAIRVNGSWFMMDVTNPDYIKGADGVNVWRPGVIPIEGPPNGSAHQTYTGLQRHSGRHVSYAVRNNVYWTIGKTA